MEFRKHGDRTKLYRYLPDERRRCMLGSISNDITDTADVDPALLAKLEPVEVKQLRAWFTGARPRVARQTAASLSALVAKMTALYNSLPQEEQQALHQRVMAEMQAWR